MKLNGIGVVAVILLAIATAFAVIGAILPWAQGPFGISKSGVEGDGILTLAAGMLACIAAGAIVVGAHRSLWKSSLSLFAMVMNAFILIVAIYDGRDAQRVVHVSNGLVRLGSGIYLTGFAGALGLLAGMLAMFAERSSDSLLSDQFDDFEEADGEIGSWRTRRPSSSRRRRRRRYALVHPSDREPE